MATIERIAEILKRGAATKVVAGVQVLARVIRVTHPRSLLALSHQDSDWRDTQSPPALTGGRLMTGNSGQPMPAPAGRRPRFKTPTNERAFYSRSYRQIGLGCSCLGEPLPRLALISLG